jgi:hypothetical protein
MHVADDDTFAMQRGAFVTPTTPEPRENHVDDVAIEYLDGNDCYHPRTLAEEAQAGGYAQEGDQSFPASGPRCVASTRGAADIGKV